MTIDRMSIEQAQEVPAPKHMVYENDYVIVYTGDNIPEQKQDVIILDPAQFRKALLLKGYKTAVENLLAQSGYELLAIDYEFKPAFHSNDERILAIGAQLELTEQQVYDEIFVFGSTLN